MLKVLDKGAIELIDTLGNDLTVVNAARASFGKESAEFGERDQGLLNFLAREGHKSPFYHPQLQFRVKCPISVQRQWYKHKVGTAENSESTRYVTVDDEFYVPETFRSQAADRKQGSGADLVGYEQLIAKGLYESALRFSYRAYTNLLSMGIAREQAREVLPLSTYTTFVWTASLFATYSFIVLRDHDHAQFEIREYAKAMTQLVTPKFPHALEALFRYRP